MRWVVLVVVALVLLSSYGGSGVSVSAKPIDTEPVTAAVGGAAETTVYDINAVRFERSASDKSKKAGDDASEIFCSCPAELSELPTMCDTVTMQCRQSFCTPLCLRMAWTPVIEVDCSRAPQWKWCDIFAKQVTEAVSAVSAQFQAHVCLDNRFCNRTQSVIDWIENANYGKHYPDHKLPIAACQQEESTSNAAAPGVREALCTGCESVLSVRLQMNSCIPGNAQRGFEHLQVGSLQERCLYVRDQISLHSHDLLTELRQRVCPCLGCCGDRTCYFPNAEHAWLTNLIETVQHKVTNQLADSGWLNIEQPKQPRQRRTASKPQRP